VASFTRSPPVTLRPRETPTVPDGQIPATQLLQLQLQVRFEKQFFFELQPAGDPNYILFATYHNFYFLIHQLDSGALVQFFINYI
jgi:hypothetical protein